MRKVLWKIGGEAGFGIMTSGLTFSKVATAQGFHIFDYVEYPSLIRGGYNAYEVVFSEDKVYGLKNNIDYLVCLNKQTYEQNVDKIHEKSFILYDEVDFTPDGAGIKISIPFKQILHELKGEGVMRNIIALGASFALLKTDLKVINNSIEKQFKKKGGDIIKFNQEFAEHGYNYIVDNYSHYIQPILIPLATPQKQLVLTGNDAFSLGSQIADCRLYSAYPMTPSSSVLTTLASWQEKTGIVARHAEDEISVINTALGASFAGVRAAVGTSGGGFALMVETLSLAGVTEIPIVIYLSQRPGPATGMPTWTEQGDLLFAVHAGHGEFPKIVLAPGDVYEMVELTAHAFNLADIYQTPVIIMSDMALSESHESLLRKKLNEFIKKYKINRGKIITTTKDTIYLRYKITNDGISPMLIPGLKDHFYQANSYEHTEDGHTTEDARPRVAQVNKRNRKTTTYLQNDFAVPKLYGDINHAEAVFVSWGSTKGPILEAIDTLKTRGRKIALIHFTHVFPLDVEKIKLLFSKKRRYILVENNSHGQFSKLLQQETGIKIDEKYLKYDGRPFSSEEITLYITKKI